MMELLLSCAYLALFLLAGFLAARRALPGASAGTLVGLGFGFGISFLAVLPAVFALLLGFTLPAVVGAGAAALVLIAFFSLKGGRLPALHAHRSDALMWACALPMLAVTVYLLHTHVLHLVDGAYHTGQSCYGDMAMHLGFIKNIAVSGRFPPLYPLLAGENRFGYPFLCECVSSVFLVLGSDLRLAYILPMLPAFVAVYLMFWQLARHLLGSAAKASLAFWLFFLGSGLGFVYFLKDKETFLSIFTGFYTTPTNDTAHNVIWVNPLADLLLPQRATLFGWCLLFPALYLLWRFCMENRPRLWLPLAVLVLPLPLMQTHSALVLVLCCLACGIYTLVCRPRVRAVLLPWLWLALVCGIVWSVQMWATVFAQSVGGQNMLRLHFNWVNNDGTGLKDNYFWFYIKNIGLVYLLLIPAFVHAEKKQRWFYGGGVLVWALAECVVFQPNTYDNNKLLFIWHALGCMLVASLLWDLWGRLRPRILGAAGLAFCCFVGMFGSVLTLGREAVSDYQQWSATDIRMASYVDENAAPDALFLTSDDHLTPVFSLAGRQIVCGSGSFVYFHGMDYTDEYQAMVSMYEAPDEASLQTWGVDYVLFDNAVYTRFQADEDWYRQRYELWYSDEDHRIYKIL